MTISFYDCVKQFAQASSCFWMSFNVFKQWFKVKSKTVWNSLNIVLHSRKTTQHTYKNCFSLMHTCFHEMRRQQANCKNFGQRLHEHQPVALNSSGGMTWCAISNEHVKSFFIRELKRYGWELRKYVKFLCVSTVRILQEIYVFHQHFTPSHSSIQATTYLNNKRPKIWIKRDLSTAWTAHSPAPDLTFAISFHGS